MIRLWIFKFQNMEIKYSVFSIKSEILNLNWQKLKELEKWFRTEPILFQAEQPVKTPCVAICIFLFLGTCTSFLLPVVESSSVLFSHKASPVWSIFVQLFIMIFVSTSQESHSVNLLLCPCGWYHLFKCWYQWLRIIDNIYIDFNAIMDMKTWRH